MTGIEQVLNQPWSQRLGWTLLHFLWHGLLVAAVLAVVMTVLRRRSPNLRYALACMALFAMVLAPAVTFCLLPGAVRDAPAGLAGQEPAEVTVAVGESPPSDLAGTDAPALHPVPDAAPAEAYAGPALPAFPADADHQASPATVGWAATIPRFLQPALPWMVAAWIAGVSLLGIWHIVGWAGLLRLKQSALPLGPVGVEGRCVAAARRIAGQLGLCRPVRLLKSARIAGPVAAGILRPAVLMPVTLLTGLPATHMEAILAHEIAHLRRYDYLVNLLQGLVETLLFYHPAVWWVSGRIRIERENCCDDVAVGVCGDHTTYVAALAWLAESCAGPLRIRLAPGGSSGVLARVRRLLGLPGGEASRANRWLAGILVMASVAIAGVFFCTATDAATSPADAATAKELEHLWGELASAEAGRSDKAIAAMAAMGDRAVAFLATRLTPTPIGAEKMEEFAKRLDSDAYAVRKRASEELAGLGLAALADARRILKRGKLSAEARARLMDFVAEYSTPVPMGANARRLDRAVAVLAKIGDEEAKGVLERLCASDSADRLGKRAQAALARLAAPREMQGTVRDGQGRPVEGAKVSLYYRRSHWGLGNSVVETVQTDKAGRFTFTRRLVYKQLNGTSYNDYYFVFATHPDYALAWQVVYSGKEPSPKELVLTEPRKQSFVVTDRQDRPLAGARVWLSSAGDRVDKNPDFRTYLSLPTDVGLTGATTDAAGAATITNLPKTRRRFVVSCPGYADAWVPGGGDKPVRLAKAAVVSGVVRSPDGKSVANAVVRLECGWAFNYYFLARTDDAGRFRFDKLFGVGGSPYTDSGGRYKVSLEHPDYTMASAKMEVKPGEVIKDFDIDAVPGTLILGRVLEPKTDRPLPGARVHGFAAGGRVNAYADQMGEFSWRVIPGKAQFRFIAAPRESYVIPDHRTVSADIQGERMPLTIYAPSVVRPMTTVSGVLLKPDGSAAAGALVYARSTVRFDGSGRDYIPQTVANSDGAFELGGVPAGHKLMLYAESLDHRWASAGSCDVPADRAPRAQVLRLKPTTTAEALIKGVDGKARPSLSVSIRPVVGGQRLVFYRRNAKTDDKGRLKINGIVPGLSYSIADSDYGRSARRGPGRYGPQTILLVPPPKRTPATMPTTRPVAGDGRE